MPVGFLERIVEARTYARLKAQHDAATTKEGKTAIRESGDLGYLVFEITFDMVKKDRD